MAAFNIKLLIGVAVLLLMISGSVVNADDCKGDNCPNDWKHGCNKDKCPKYGYGTVSYCKGKYCDYYCKDGWKDCDGKKYNGCEVNTKTNVNHCGRCYNKCKSKSKYGSAKCWNGYCKDEQCKGNHCGGH